MPRMTTLSALFSVAFLAAPAVAQDSLTTLAHQALRAVPTASLAAAPPATDFAEGTFSFQFYGSTVVGDSEHGYIHTAHVGAGWYFVDDLSINLEAIGGWVDSKTDDDGGVGGLDLLFRWHFLKDEDWSLYVDGGAGFQQATTNFPSDSHHNFRPQVGMGFTYDLTDRARLMGGARWLHISNASTTEGNDGLDAAQLYLGLMMPF